MSNKYYIVSEEEINNIRVQGWPFRRCIKSKKSVQVIAEGEFNSGVIGNKFILDYLDEHYQGNNIKIYIEKVK